MPPSARPTLVRSVVLMAMAMPAGLTFGQATRPDPGSLEAALEEVNAQCPASYPDELTVVPSETEFAELEIATLIEMLGSWNPAVRTAASRELAGREVDIVSRLATAAKDEDAHVRAGASTALANIIKREVSNWKTTVPDAKNADEGQTKVREQFAPLEPMLIELTQDDSRDVRAAAVDALAALAPQTPAAARAMIDVLSDPDQYIASQAVVLLEKYFNYEALESDEIVESLRLALQAELPRGKGHAMRILSKLKPESQRRLIPEMLELLDQQPMRDTMFGASGQAEAVALLTKLKVAELLPRLTTLMDKSMRGPGLFEPCVKSAYDFGKETKSILPDLQKYDQELTQRIDGASSRNRPALEDRQAKIRKLIDHVESL